MASSRLCLGNGKLFLASQPQEIEKLAYDLGGIAHVLVEPDRGFSFRLRDETMARNAYGGTIGLSIPGRGITRRYYYPGWRIQDARELAEAVRAATMTQRNWMPSFGWDWSTLQEEALRAQRREREKDSATEDEWRQLYEEEIENLQDKVRELEQVLHGVRAESVDTDEAELSISDLAHRLGPEAYVGEISDRLRFAAKTTLSDADRIGLDPRSKVIFQRVADRLPVSPGRRELQEDLKRATKDPRRMADALISLLGRHGYSRVQTQSGS